MAFADSHTAPRFPHLIGVEGAAAGPPPARVAGHGRTPMERGSNEAAAARRSPATVRLPCMLYAALGPVPSVSGLRVEAAIAEARRAPGVLRVLRYDRESADAAIDGSRGAPLAGGIAVVTRGHWLARQSMTRLLDQCGGVDSRPAGEADPAPGLSDACIVQFVDGCLRLWMATAELDQAHAVAAHIAGLPAGQVDLRILGLPLDRSGVGEDLAVLAPAIALALELQPAPVQILVTREFSSSVAVPANGTVTRVVALAA